MIVALPQFLELLLCDVQFLPSIEVDGVDEKVGMNVFSVYIVALGKRNLLWDLLPDHIEEHVLEVDHAE